MRASFIIFFIGILCVSACKKANRFDCFKRTGSIIKEERVLPYFDKIQVYNKFDIIITQDTINSVVIEAGENIVSNIETTVEDGRLTIRNNNKCNFTRSYEKTLNIFIHIKNLVEFTHRGAGDARSTNTILSEVLTVNSWDGIDTINFKVNTKRVNAYMHTGNADIIVSGSTDSCFIYGRGNGFIRAGNLQSNYVYVNNISSGDYFIWAKDKIDALVQYIGNIYYEGDPANINKQESNKGRLIHL